MSIKLHNPVTPGRRHLVSIDRAILHKGGPVKMLTSSLKRISGRNNRGVITVRSRGGGHKRTYRMVTFSFKSILGIASVKRIEYDPNRTAFIALIEFMDTAQLMYILAADGIKIGDKINFNNGEIQVGSILALKDIPVGFNVHNIELNPGGGSKLARSAGSYASIVNKDSNMVSLKLRSGEIYKVNCNCMAAIGVVSNLDNKNVVLGKAGRNRWFGFRPKVRGVAMNPVDHPHGGGEGKSGTGGPPVTPWGKMTKGAKTVKKRRKG